MCYLDKRDEDSKDTNFCSGVNSFDGEDIGDNATVKTTHSDAHVEVSAGIIFFFKEELYLEKSSAGSK